MPYKRPIVYTMKDLKRICFNVSPSDYAKDPVISELRPAFTAKLRGQEFALRFDDGGRITYRFDRFGLSWKEDVPAPEKEGAGSPVPQESWQEEYAECLESTREGVFLVHHLRTHVNPCEAATLIIDTNTRLVTMVYDRFGKASQTRDVNRKVRFGWYGEDPGIRHDLTDELVGKVIDWKFADKIKIHTLYCNVQCLAFISPAPPEAPGWADFYPTFNPTKYVKIAEDLYLVSFDAPHACGMEVSMLMDLRKFRALGAAFGLDAEDRFCSYTFGAKGAYASLGFLGSYTVD